MQAIDAPYIPESTGHVAASGHAKIKLLDDRDPGVGDDHRRRLAVISLRSQARLSLLLKAEKVDADVTEPGH
jgi:hypothetical protein